MATIHTKRKLWTSPLFSKSARKQHAASTQVALHKTNIPPQETRVYFLDTLPFPNQLTPSRTSEDADPLTKCHPPKPTTPPWRPQTGTPPPSESSHPQPPTALAPSASGNLQSSRHLGMNTHVVSLRPPLARTQMALLPPMCQSPQRPEASRTFHTVVLAEAPYPSSPGRSWRRRCPRSFKVAGRCLVPREVRPGMLSSFRRGRGREVRFEFSSGCPGHLRFTVLTPDSGQLHLRVRGVTRL